MCPTCGHTVQRINEGVNPKTWWCPRCGTLKTDGVPDNEHPKLLEWMMLYISEQKSAFKMWHKVQKAFAIGEEQARELCRKFRYDEEQANP